MLKDNVLNVLYVEENGLIDALAFIIKTINSVYIDQDVKNKLIKLLNILVDDTIRHSNLLSNLLVELSA